MTNKVQVYLTKEQKLLNALEASKLSASKEIIRLAKIGYQLMEKDPKEGAYLLYMFDQNNENNENNVHLSEKKEEQNIASKAPKTGFDSLLD